MNRPKLFDSHCHIHEAAYPGAEAAYRRALRAGVERLICVGTDEITSAEALSFAEERRGCLASVGLHPHEAVKGQPALRRVRRLAEGLPARLAAVGECGLDYFYSHSPVDAQLAALRFQMELALELRLPLIFHVRQAFDDFWPVFDDYAKTAPAVRGVLHSFTDNLANLDKALDRGLLIGVNGIATFSRDPSQQAVWRRLPLDSVLLETDAPFLTPVPLRGKVNEPAFIGLVADRLAELKQLTPGEIIQAATENANSLFLNPKNQNL